MYIQIDGIDGCGKSTLVHGLARLLEERGEAVRIVKQPSNSPIGEKVKAALEDENHPERSKLAELFMLDRVMAYRTSVKPALDAGQIVICDRSALSTYAYQGTNEEKRRSILKETSKNVTPADLILLIDTDVDEALDRVLARGNTSSLDLDKEKQLLAAERYLEAGTNFYSYFCNDIEIIDGNGSQEEILQEAFEVIIASLTTE